MIVSKEGMDGIFSPRSSASRARAALLAAPVRARADELRPAALGRDDLHLELAPRQAPERHAPDVAAALVDLPLAIHEHLHRDNSRAGPVVEPEGELAAVDARAPGGERQAAAQKDVGRAVALQVDLRVAAHARAASI